MSTCTSFVGKNARSGTSWADIADRNKAENTEKEEVAHIDYRHRQEKNKDSDLSETCKKTEADYLPVLDL